MGRKFSLRVASRIINHDEMPQFIDYGVSSSAAVGLVEESEDDEADSDASLMRQLDLMHKNINDNDKGKFFCVYFDVER